MKWLSWIYLAAIIGVAIFASLPDMRAIEGEGEAVRSVYWSDGDSGRLDGKPFRLSNVDAPEKGGVGSQGGAKCEAEREQAFKAKQFIVEVTRNADVRISKSHGVDRYDREVVDISVNGKDLAELGLEAGVYKPWPHLGQRALIRKPNWCAVRLASR